MESKKNLKKHIFNDKQNLWLVTKNSNKSTLYKFLSNNMKEISYWKKLFCWNFLNKYHFGYEHLKFLKLLNVIRIKDWWHLQNQNIKNFVKNCSQCQTVQFSQILVKWKTFKHIINSTLQSFEKWIINLINILLIISNDNE